MKIIEQTNDHTVARSTCPDHEKGKQSMWKDIHWVLAEQYVRRMQERIYRATKDNDMKRVRNLQKLLSRSYYNKLLAIRIVTESNSGKDTPGVDNKLYRTPEEKWELSQEPFDFRYHIPSPVKRVYIPKSDGSKRPLGIPTIKDRVMQAIVKVALEPEFEARFDPNSYGFRPGRCTMDAMAQIRWKLGGLYCSQWILDADISKCFDNIAHDSILLRIPVFKSIINRWLKAGAVELGNFTETETGTPQGGIISPLLANIALDGMERLFEGHKNQRISLVRYADDFVVIAPSREILESYVLPTLTIFLKQRGLNLNKVKTTIVHRTEGFNFLGFSVRYFSGRSKSGLLISPQKDRINRVLRKIKSKFRSILSTPVGEVIKDLNSIIRGWLYYYRYVNAKKSFSYLKYRLWKVIWYGLKRLHKNKPAKWIFEIYFQGNETIRWKFSSSGQILIDPESIPVRRYQKVNENFSPFDSTLKSYWKQRSRRHS